MIRAFVALPLPEELVLTCLRAQGHASTGRAVARGNLHVTLLYLGEQPAKELEAFADELDAVRSPAIDLRLTGIDVIGGFKGARHMVASVEPVPALLELQATVARKARTVGFNLERRRFRPHVTLVRDFRGDTLPPFSGDLPAARVDHFALYRSTLKTTGAEYDILADFPLAR